MTADELKSRRKGIGLTMEVLSTAIGVPKATYANWEHGRAKPSRAAKDKLEECLASLEKTGKVDLRIPIDPELRKSLEAKAKKKGMTAGELAAKILGLSGLLIFAAIIGAVFLAGTAIESFF
tara:strand:- start:15 stop:380 length:366 start_codon:yes stop_codon:yes gene_type:complete